MDSAAPTPAPEPNPSPGRIGQRAPAPAISAALKSSWQQQRKDFSAGGVAFRHTEHGYEAALIATRGGTRWQLPKGTCEANETLEETAMREVVEEVGLQTEVVTFLRTIEYWYWDTYHRAVAELVHKRVDFFLLRVTGGVLTDTCYEVDATGWFLLPQALELLSFSGEQEVMRNAIEHLAP